jgi:hypothetical protein
MFLMRMNKILTSAQFVVKHSEHITIDSKAIDKFSAYFHQKHMKHWFHEASFNIKKLNAKERLHFLLVFNAISFSYWGDPKWNITYKGKKVDGAYGMIAAIGKAIEHKYPILDPKYLSTLSQADFENILKGNVQIPLCIERLQILREVGNVLLKKYNGDFSNLVLKANGDSQKLLELIISNFPSFQDTAIYQGKKIYIYKRAQLLVSDIYQAFEGKQFGSLKNIHELTACADYKLPLVLRRLGIFTYSKELSSKVDSRIQIHKGSREEIEIRANTIWAVELIKRKVKKNISQVDSIHINDHLWMLGQKKLKNDHPYHLTRTTAY